MASSSNHSFTSSTGTGIGDGAESYPRFKNKLCKCGVRAVVKISESTPNPGRLYYKCANGECGFWAWCNVQGGSVSNVHRDEINNWVAIKDDIRDGMKEECEVIRRELKEIVAIISSKLEAPVNGNYCSSIVLPLFVD